MAALVCFCGTGMAEGGGMGGGMGFVRGMGGFSSGLRFGTVGTAIGTSFLGGTSFCGIALGMVAVGGRGGGRFAFSGMDDGTGGGGGSGG